MSLRTTVMMVLAAVLIVAAGEPILGPQCPPLIKQANEQLAGMDQHSEQVQKAKELVAEADRLHQAGNHAEAVAKVQAALAGLQ